MRLHVPARARSARHQAHDEIRARRRLRATGSLDITILLVGGPAKLHLSGATIAASVGTSSAPKASADGKTPGHLAAEHVLGGLTTFQAMTGTLCGNISAASLARVPM